MIAQAQEETSATIFKIMLTFVGAASFCLLSLLAPDSSLLTSGVTLNVPFAGPVSFLGFIIVGPVILIALRIYLQIYVKHYRRLEPIGRWLHPVRAPTLVVSRNLLLRGFTGLVLYLLLPLTMLMFTWKVAVLPGWLPSLICATTAVIAWHLLMLLMLFDGPWLSKASVMLLMRFDGHWLSKASVIFAVAIILTAVTLVLQQFHGEPLRRSFDLFRADLSGQWLVTQHLEGANLERADLAGANLEIAHLSREPTSREPTSREPTSRSPTSTEPTSR